MTTTHRGFHAAQAVKAVLCFYHALGFERLSFLWPEGSVAPKTPQGFESLEALKDHIGPCTRCKLSKGRSTVVFGEGNPDARLMFVGEGPGREEDRQGRPFVGEAGQLLTRLINRMGFQREDVYIANIVKCRPPGNRDPETDEIDTCLPFLKEQIRLVSPEVVIALGRVAAQTLLGVKTPISRLRGKFQDFEGTPLMPTFHPAYLLRNPKDKLLVWGDAQQVLARLGLEVT